LDVGAAVIIGVVDETTDIVGALDGSEIRKVDTAMIPVALGIELAIEAEKEFDPKTAPRSFAKSAADECEAGTLSAREKATLHDMIQEYELSSSAVVVRRRTSTALNEKSLMSDISDTSASVATAERRVEAEASLGSDVVADKVRATEINVRSTADGAGVGSAVGI
jgi:hypothetical protein